MTHAEALIRAQRMRHIAARMARVAADARQPSRLRYGAVIVQEEAEEWAAQYDGIAAEIERRRAARA